jgi:hypothetical protein
VLNLGRESPDFRRGEDVNPLNDAASEFLEERLMPEAIFFGAGVAVEHGYIGAIVNDLRENGFLVR